MTRMSDLKQRLGIFRVPETLVKDTPEEAIQMFSELGVVVTKAEYLYHCQEFEYYGICEQFEPLTSPVEVPEYQVVNENGDWRFKKK